MFMATLINPSVYAIISYINFLYHKTIVLTEVVFEVLVLLNCYKICGLATISNTPLSALFKEACSSVMNAKRTCWIEG